MWTVRGWEVAWFRAMPPVTIGGADAH